MPGSKAQRLAHALDEFINSSPDVEAAAVVSFDGLPMASALPEDVEEDRLGAMSAALLSLGEQAAVGLGRGQLHQVFVEGEHGFVFLMSARDQAVLAAVAQRSAKIGFMLFEMRRAAERIGDVLLSREDRGERSERPAWPSRTQPREQEPVIDRGSFRDREPEQQDRTFGDRPQHERQGHEHDHEGHEPERAPVTEPAGGSEPAAGGWGTRQLEEPEPPHHGHEQAPDHEPPGDLPHRGWS